MTAGAYDNAQRGIVGLPEPLPGFESDVEDKPKVKGHTLTPDELVEAVEKKPKKPSKKHKRKHRSLRDMAYETMSASNVVTRDDMARGSHKPETLGEVLTETFGPPSEGIVATEALSIIDKHGRGIRTGMTEWRAIQDMVEQAYRQGYDDGQARARS